MMLLAVFAVTGCLTVAANSDSIRAADLAGDYPEMAALTPETVIAPAPLPGFTRIFHAADLRRIAAAYALPGVPDRDLCVRRAVAPLAVDRLIEAMRHEWPDASIEIVDFTRQPAPEGTIRFPKSGLHSGPAGWPTALWTGWVEYGQKGRFSIWARVKIGINAEHVVAITDLRPGHAISGEDVRVARRDEVPGTGTPFAAALDQVIGRVPRQAIRAGQVLRLDQIGEPKAVSAGDAVKVLIQSGGAQLQLDAVAEGAGAIGETVFVRNPDSHRRFRARVESKGRVSVDAGGIKP